MSNELIDRINKAEKICDERKLEKAKLEEKLKMLKENQAKIIEDLKAFDILPENAEKELGELKARIEKQLTEIEEILK